MVLEGVLPSERIITAPAWVAPCGLLDWLRLEQLLPVPGNGSITTQNGTASRRNSITSTSGGGGAPL